MPGPHHSIRSLTASSFILKKSLANQKCFQSPRNIWKALISEQGLFWRERGKKKPTPELNLDPWKSRVPPKVPVRGLEKQLSEQSAHSSFICHGIFCFWNINTSVLRGILKQTRTCCQMNNPQTLVNCLIVFKKVAIVLTLSQLLEWRLRTLNHIQLKLGWRQIWNLKIKVLFSLALRAHGGKSADRLQSSGKGLQTCWHVWESYLNVLM